MFQPKCLISQDASNYFKRYDEPKDKINHLASTSKTSEVSQSILYSERDSCEIEEYRGKNSKQITNSIISKQHCNQIFCTENIALFSLKKVKFQQIIALNDILFFVILYCHHAISHILHC